MVGVVESERECDVSVDALLSQLLSQRALRGSMSNSIRAAIAAKGEMVRNKRSLGDKETHEVR